jgi:hypothetical protein
MVMRFRYAVLAVLFLSISPIIPAHTANAGDSSLSDALIDAAFFGKVDKVRGLLDSGADINAKHSSGDRPVLFIVAGAMQTSDVDYRANLLGVAKLLLQRGANPDAQTPIGKTALMLAAEAGDPELVELLLSKGANPSLKDASGHTALALAQTKGHPYTIRLLTPSDVGADDSAKITQSVRDVLKEGGMQVFEVKAFPKDKKQPSDPPKYSLVVVYADTSRSGDGEALGAVTTTAVALSKHLEFDLETLEAWPARTKGDRRARVRFDFTHADAQPFFTWIDLKRGQKLSRGDRNRLKEWSSTWIIDRHDPSWTVRFNITN